MSKAKILIVDDELIMRESLGEWLERDGYQVMKADSGESAVEMLKNTMFDVLLVDMKMEKMSGIEVLKHVKRHDPEVAVVIITAYGSISGAVDAMKHGAWDYLLKPFDPDELGMLIQKILQHQAQNRENQFLKAQDRDRTRFENLIGQTSAMQAVFNLIEDVARAQSTVLITGETGTGKGLAAKAIHAKSSRAKGPFAVVNCGAFPERLLESELFGFQKGAFTDAKTTKKGRLELAHGGTLFLDEIGEISPRMQVDLLRVLEDRVFYRLGGTQPIEADFRIIAATNRDLEKAIHEKVFREDFYYRLNVISFSMPPLRDRKADISLLSLHFLKRFAQETNAVMAHVSRRAMEVMMCYDWPGNVRELENAIERAVVVGKGKRMMPEDLPMFRAEHMLSAANFSLKEVEREHIKRILAVHDWNISKTAATLRIDRSTLYTKIRRYRLKRSA